DADVVYIKNREVRAEIAQALLGMPGASAQDAGLAERMKTFESSGLISPALLARPELQPTLEKLEGDLVRTAKQMDALRGALAVMQPSQLLGGLRVLPPGDGRMDSPWSSIGEIMLLGADVATLPPAFRERVPQPIAGLDIDQQRQVAAAWRDLARAWNRGDVQNINASVAAIAAVLPEMKPELYPAQSRLEWESWYFRSGNLSWVWLVYLTSIVFLLLGVVYRWRRATTVGLAVFGIAFLLQTAAVGLRWYISDRWPNSNMFEAVTTAAWMGAALAVIAEVVLRRTAMRGLLALGGAGAGMVALMAAYLLPAQLNPNISNMMPVLHDVWLYIHTNVVIFSYALIFMAAISAIVYLVMRAFGAPAVYARVGGAGAAIALAAGSSADGAGSAPAGRGGLTALGEVLDGVTMLLMELSFIMLWSGIVMGAIWADHSWGRPWGWDPKEVFALNTFLVFALLIHIRFKARDKGLWTAVLTVVGAGVMLFNWIVINFVITGLHSYA
ncbi:MAG: cytochrome c biogenesis protein CcsA, partial [Phycisphaerae bacterium]|nr:cytochrome c biogenesis protein CcsA [Phycisphaerae bacterium]